MPPPSQVAATYRPSGKNAAQRAASYRVSSVSFWTFFPVLGFYSHTNREVPAVVAMRLPSGENASDRTFAR